MKSIILLYICVVACSGWKFSEELKPIAEACIKDLSIELPSDPPTFDDKLTGDMMCFIKCLHTKSGLYSENGDVDMDKVKQRFSPNEEVLGKIEACISANKQEDICEKIAYTHLCIKKEVMPAPKP